MSKCISGTLTLLVRSSAWWNISLATLSNPVYCEANALPHRLRDAIVMITGGALMGLCRPGSWSGCLLPMKMCMNVLQEPLGDCSSHQFSPADSLVTSITVGWILKWLCLHFQWTVPSCCGHTKNRNPFISMEKVSFDSNLACDTAWPTSVKERMGVWVSCCLCELETLRSFACRCQCECERFLLKLAVYVAFHKLHPLVALVVCVPRGGSYYHHFPLPAVQSLVFPCGKSLILTQYIS